VIPLLIATLKGWLNLRAQAAPVVVAPGQYA
jgi:hypothetical protein